MVQKKFHKKIFRPRYRSCWNEGNETFHRIIKENQSRWRFYLSIVRAENKSLSVVQIEFRRDLRNNYNV